jgi:hypothetical protein
VARHLAALLHHYGLEAPPDSLPQHRFLTTGVAADFDRDAARLIGLHPHSASIRWDAAGERLLPGAALRQHSPPGAP